MIKYSQPTDNQKKVICNGWSINDALKRDIDYKKGIRKHDIKA